MIGYSVPIALYHLEADAPDQVSALLTLDIESDEPVLDVRLAGNNNLIISCSVEDAYTALYEIRGQLNQWQKEQQEQKGTEVG